MEKIKTKIKNLSKLPLDKAIKKVFTKSCEVPYLQWRKQLIKNKPIYIGSSFFEKFVSNCKFFFDEADKKILLEKLEELNLVEDIIKDAERICSHTFNLLGSGDIALGELLPWNEDFKTNFVWENKFYKDIKIVDLSNDADVKVPWELSRFQHLFTLGKAYWITNDEKYATEFKDEIEDWTEKNPVEMSVNWTCTMDVGIRAANWIAAYFFFKDSKSIGKEFWTKFNQSLYLHGRFIYKNLENKGAHTGNHYLSNIVGLVWLGLYFGSFTVKDLKRKNNPENWLEYGLKELEKEMFIQNNSDGTNYEASTSYHRLVTELYLLTTILCNKNNINFTKEYMNRLEKMCTFIMYINKPNGLSPIIGDADDGRLLILSNYSSWVRNDFRHVLGIAGELFDCDDFRSYGKEYSEDALWINQYLKKDVAIAKPLPSIEFKDGGYYILRNDRVYCFIRCGELSFKGQGVHSHNDQLSFELNLDGEDLIIDPGTYVYTSDFQLRNLFRSTSMHNTIQIENHEQNDFNKEEIFAMNEQTFAECMHFDDVSFKGKHYGYSKKQNVIHEREFKVINNGIIILDKLNNSSNSKKTLCLYLNPDSTLFKIRHNLIRVVKGDIKVDITLNDEVWNIEDGWFSSQYGKKMKTKVLKTTTFKENIEIKISLFN